VAFESPFFGENVQSMLKLGRAQGVAMAAALTRGLPVYEYAPRRIKLAITGRGGASKAQVAALLKTMLQVEYNIERLDATDGLAVALCHHFVSSSPINGAAGGDRVKALGGGIKASTRRGSRTWESFLGSHPDRVIDPGNGPGRPAAKQQTPQKPNVNIKK
jgi:crossover junction endodeoxyribonuclease RuvC